VRLSVIKKLSLCDNQLCPKIKENKKHNRVSRGKNIILHQSSWIDGVYR
jgi:hypothetical protein